MSKSQNTTTQSLGALLKFAREVMRKDKWLNGDLDRMRLLTSIMFLEFSGRLQECDFRVL